nr:DUF2971 domain-containing protein [Methylobacterium sp. Leaf122]
MDTTANQLVRLREIFFPYASGRQRDLELRRGRFVHYTTASVAVSIIQNKQVWMRNASTMNDFMEVEYGYRCLNYAYDSDAGVKFKNILDALNPGWRPGVENLFNGWLQSFRSGTYLSCISEHMDSEDTFGRLSMWRAYGGETGIAIVMNNRPFVTPSDALGAYTSPVAYMSPDQFKAEFQRIANKMEENSQFLSQLEPNIITSSLFNMLRFTVLGTKHPGFHEEREWRIIHTPGLENSDRLVKDLQIVRGTPQVIYKIPLKDIPDGGFIGAEIPQLVERVIIGPTQYPLTMYEAFVDLLTQAGVVDAASKVRVSDIPLRQ